MTKSASPDDRACRVVGATRYPEANHHERTNVAGVRVGRLKGEPGSEKLANQLKPQIQGAFRHG
jgi:hypothetical protein